mmetsp:Transcript_18702/g.53957  ORF Transcript_18702/g.53957 Transcript_18702/m.53957 type:complete len:559 (-) Transcript_18702:66-1742(-)
MHFRAGAVSALLLVLLSSPGRGASASHVVSGLTARLPQSLSAVISDLEAEGATKITSCAFLASRSVSKSTRSRLFRSLFAVTGDGDHDDEVNDGSTTAFGKSLGEEHESSSDEDGEDPPGVGIAVANPPPGYCVGAVAATVQACGGTVVFVADRRDLDRGEGLFEALAPAVERLLASRQDDSEGELGSAPLAELCNTLIVVVDGARSNADLADARAKFEKAAASMLRSVVQPDGSARADGIGDVFRDVEYVTSLGPVDGLLANIEGASTDPSSAASAVASAVYDLEGGGAPAPSGLTKAVDVAAARVLGPASHKSLEDCLNTVGEYVGGPDKSIELVANFGELCDAAADRALGAFDGQVSSRPALKSSAVTKRIRSDLVEGMYADLSDLYEGQLALLRASCLDGFKNDLKSVRITANLPNDVEGLVKSASAAFASGAKKLRSKSSAASSWPGPEATGADLRRELRESSSRLLKMAKVSGKYRPVPRKGVTLGFHWLLPKPFGNDYRQEPWNVRSADNLVYTPPDKISDVSKADVKTGDWRRSVVPAPSASEMVYMGGN